MMKIRSESVGDLLSAFYDDEDDETAWARRIMKTAIRTIDGAAGGTSVRLHTSFDERSTFRLDHTVLQWSEGMNAQWSPPVLDAYKQMAPAFLERSFHRTHGSVTSENLGVPNEVFTTSSVWRSTWPLDIVDAVGLVTREPSGRGMCVTVGLRSNGALHGRERRLLARLATHLGAGFRLRETVRSSRLDQAEAVLSSNGKILHAHEIVKKQRGRLDDGRRRRDYARENKHDAQKALQVWKGLVAGRWSLVDHFDTDGKRFLLAMRNAPTVDRRADLTPRERRVCAFAAMGHRDKEIAYMLGLTAASISASLHRAFVKLHVTTRAELASVWKKA